MSDLYGRGFYLIVMCIFVAIVLLLLAYQLHYFIYLKWNEKDRYSMCELCILRLQKSYQYSLAKGKLRFRNISAIHNFKRWYCVDDARVKGINHIIHVSKMIFHQNILNHTTLIYPKVFICNSQHIMVSSIMILSTIRIISKIAKSHTRQKWSRYFQRKLIFPMTAWQHHNTPILLYRWFFYIRNSVCLVNWCDASKGVPLTHVSNTCCVRYIRNNRDLLRPTINIHDRSSMGKHPVNLFAKGIYNIAYVYWYLHI